MFSYATKVLTGLTVAALIAAGVYYAVEGGRAGAVLFLLLGLSALLATVTVVASGVVDIAPHVAADAPAPERNAHTPGEAATGSLWPVLAAASVALLAVGAATDMAVVYAGVIALVLAAFGWFSKAWSDHPSWTPRVREPVVDRAVAPWLIPVACTVLTLFIAVSISRILLATDVAVAPWISLVVAVAILAACAWVASRPRLAPSALTALGVLGALSALGMGVAGAAQGEREFHHKAHVVKPVHITAKNNEFREKRVEAKLDHGEVVVEFQNNDPEVFHNVALYAGPELEARAIFNGVGFPGVEEYVYRIKVPAGAYTFRCDFHTNMVGEFVVGGG